MRFVYQGVYRGLCPCMVDADSTPLLLAPHCRSICSMRRRGGGGEQMSRSIKGTGGGGSTRIYINEAPRRRPFGCRRALHPQARGVGVAALSHQPALLLGAVALAPAAAALALARLGQVHAARTPRTSAQDSGRKHATRANKKKRCQSPNARGNGTRTLHPLFPRATPRRGPRPTPCLPLPLPHPHPLPLAHCLPCVCLLACGVCLVLIKVPLKTRAAQHRPQPQALYF